MNLLSLPTLPVVLRNPVFEREFVRFCRTKRWYVLRTTLVASLTLVLWLFFLQGRADIASRNLDAVGRSLFAAACFVLVLFVMLATPGLTADLIASERRTGNLEVLLSTPLPRSGIVFGKVLSRIALLFAMIATTFPAISVTLLFGGVRVEQVVALFLISVGLVLAYSGPSLLLSTFTERAGVPALLAYLVALAPSSLLFLEPPKGARLIGAVQGLALPAAGNAGPPPFVASALLILGLGASTFLLCALLCILRLKALRHGAALPAARPGRAATPSTRRCWDRPNPIATWETRRVRGAFGRGPIWILLGILLATEGVCWLVPAVRSLAASAASQAAIVTAESFAILLFAALAGSTTVVSDREQGRIQLFRLTRLTPREVILGKVLGTARGVLPLVLIPALHVLLVAGFRGSALPGTLLFAVLLALVIAVCAADGVLNSIQGATAQSAIIHSIWHFCWLTLFLPLLQVLIPLVLQGKRALPEGPQFSVLYPLHRASMLAFGQTGKALDVFGLVVWILLLLLFAFGYWMMLTRGVPIHHHRPAGSRPERPRGTRRSPSALPRRPRRAAPRPLPDWRDSWQRLAAHWDEEI